MKTEYVEERRSMGGREGAEEERKTSLASARRRLLRQQRLPAYLDRISLQPRCVVVIGCARAQISAKKLSLSRGQAPEVGHYDRFKVRYTGGNEKHARGIRLSGQL